MRHSTALTRHHPLGTPTSWALDFAIIGFASGLLAPLLVSQGQLGVEYLASTAIAGLVVGALLGALLPTLLGRLAASVPFGILLFAGPVVGAVWGASTGLVGGVALVVTRMQFAEDLAIVSVILAGVAGAMQFAWLWLPYTLLRAAGRKTWAVVAIACTTPVIGYGLLVLSTSRALA